MLSMRIVRAPLKDQEYRVILDEYNRMTEARIPMKEFVHWVNKSPAGKAWHAILETEEGKIVGHTSVFPFRTAFESGAITPAKSEFSMLHEDFRKEKVLGYEREGKPAFILLLDRLFRHCQEHGWSPIFASTNEKNQVFTRKVGLRPLEFPLWECLLILRPASASRLTPNINDWQRAGLFSAGLIQSIVWSAVPRILSKQEIAEVPIEKNGFPVESSRIAFFQDSESLHWRYLDGQYVRFEISADSGDYLIAKRGSPDKFLRVCQWKIGGRAKISGLLAAMAKQAQREKALGVRWAVYEGEAGAEELARQMRVAGFLVAKRTRIMMVHKKDERYLDKSLWKINDSLFSFDP